MLTNTYITFELNSDCIHELLRFQQWSTMLVNIIVFLCIDEQVVIDWGVFTCFVSSNIPLGYCIDVLGSFFNSGDLGKSCCFCMHG